MRLHLGWVRCAARHDNLHLTHVIRVRVQFRAGGHDAVVNFDADPSAHTDDHGLSVNRLNTGIEVVQDVGHNSIKPVVCADERLDLRPFSGHSVGFVYLKLFGYLVELLVRSLMMSSLSSIFATRAS